MPAVRPLSIGLQVTEEVVLILHYMRNNILVVILGGHIYDESQELGAMAYELTRTTMNPTSASLRTSSIASQYRYIG